ncbi:MULTISPECIES: A24 family peptidase [Sphingopyxis]|jgi:prepilin peptidase CpaA|uniref:Peptidase A24A, prepilin type IV n=1 Tax=Sphingopyxis granuli TaxID=267128 RepID=A0AA86GLB9_9SPHN|nr:MULTISPECIES: prepilin peptidase [Sphingopyxis]AMG74284.1 Peptidase A24A, prepilin type IV [Sphingopyxis granuli]APW72491.1 peptidase [Sphingopyxis granuli]AVA14045.1 peptidase [Sphingopyxis sp. MG]ODU27814.1 MAG: peptidase [Sphingopyxis sp. SCN 67-31]
MDRSSIAFGLMALLAALMIAAAVSDLRSRSISNGLNGTIALLAIPFWIASGLSLWPDIPIQFGAAFAVFLLFAGLFAIGAMGGGDVKMIGAVMLWIPLPLFVPMLTVMALGGGLLSAIMLVHIKLRPSGKPVEVPYGVAIAAAGLWALHQHYLNQFQFIGSA